MNELETAREQIVNIDAEMARLFEARMQACDAIADYKKAHGLPIKDAVREAALIARNRKLIGDAEVERDYVRFLQGIIGVSCDHQARRIHGRRVSYSGVEGAFAQIAAKKMFPEAELVAVSDFVESYRAVERGEFDCAVLRRAREGGTLTLCARAKFPRLLRRSAARRRSSTTTLPRQGAPNKSGTARNIMLLGE